MLKNLRAVLCLSTLLYVVALVPANATTSRISNFLFACDGSNKTIAFVAGAGGGNNPALPASTKLLIIAAEVVLFENHGGLQYVLLSGGAGDRTKQLANMGLPPSATQPGGGGHVFNESPYGLAPVTTDAAGKTTLQIDGACNPGFGNLQGTFTVWFTGPGIP